MHSIREMHEGKKIRVLIPALYQKAEQGKTFASFSSFIEWMVEPLQSFREWRELKNLEKDNIAILKKSGKNADGSWYQEFPADMTLLQLVEKLHPLIPDKEVIPRELADHALKTIPKKTLTQVIRQTCVQYYDE